MATLTALLVLAFVATFSAVGLVYYRITFLNHKGDISHSEDGVMFFLDDGDFNETGSDELVDAIAHRHAREGDKTYKFKAYELDCEE